MKTFTNCNKVCSFITLLATFCLAPQLFRFVIAIGYFFILYNIFISGDKMPIKTNSEPVVDIVKDSYGRRPRRTKKYIDLQNLQVFGESKFKKDWNNFDSSLSEIKVRSGHK